MEFLFLTTRLFGVPEEPLSFKRHEIVPVFPPNVGDPKQVGYELVRREMLLMTGASVPLKKLRVEQTPDGKLVLYTK